MSTPQLETSRSSSSEPRRWTRSIVVRSCRASLVVGTLLTLLNQGDEFLKGCFSAALWWKIPLTYLVPFFVATYGALSPDRRTVHAERHGPSVSSDGACHEEDRQAARAFRYASNDR